MRKTTRADQPTHPFHNPLHPHYPSNPHTPLQRSINKTPASSAPNKPPAPPPSTPSHPSSGSASPSSLPHPPPPPTMVSPASTPAAAASSSHARHSLFLSLPDRRPRGRCVCAICTGLGHFDKLDPCNHFHQPWVVGCLSCFTPVLGWITFSDWHIEMCFREYLPRYLSLLVRYERSRTTANTAYTKLEPSIESTNTNP